VRFSSTAVQRLVGTVAHALHRPALDASVSYSGDSIGQVSSRPGVDVRVTQLTAAIETALTDPTAGRVIAIPLTRTLPRHTTSELAAQFPTIITVGWRSRT
jgi:vancomycin resistance protein YoaR